MCQLALRAEDIGEDASVKAFCITLHVQVSTLIRNGYSFIIQTNDEPP